MNIIWSNNHWQSCMLVWWLMMYIKEKKRVHYNWTDNNTKMTEIYKYSKEGWGYWKVIVRKTIEDELYIEIQSTKNYSFIFLPKEEAIKLAKAILKAFEND